MKASEFDKVVRETPRVVPFFEVIKVPRWIKDTPAMDVKRGDTVYFCELRDTVVLINEPNKGWGVDIRPAYLKFIGYDEQPGGIC